MITETDVAQYIFGKKDIAIVAVIQNGNVVHALSSDNQVFKITVEKSNESLELRPLPQKRI